MIDADTYFFIHDGPKYWLGRPSDIIMLTQDENYTTVSTSDGRKIVVCGNLGQYEEKLPPIFFRANRSCIINLAHVKIMTWQKKVFHFIMDDDSETMMSRQQSVLFRQERSLAKLTTG